MNRLTAAELFGDSGIPLRVVDSTTDKPTGIVAAESVKVIFTTAGWAKVGTRNDGIAASTGTIITIPADLECWGLPERYSRAVTFYVDPEYLADQVRWLARTHPLVHQLHRAISGDMGLQRLQLPAKAMRAMGTQLVRLAQLPRRQEHEFTMLSIASDIFDSVGRIAGVAARRLADGGPTLGRPRAEVVAAVDLLRDQLSRDWRIDELAREVALSPSQLRRLFGTQIGVSPAACLAGLRAERMAELLGTTDLGIAEAARASGWRNPTVAARVFKKRYGVSPRSYTAFCRTRAERVQPA